MPHVLRPAVAPAVTPESVSSPVASSNASPRLLRAPGNKQKTDLADVALLLQGAMDGKLSVARAPDGGGILLFARANLNVTGGGRHVQVTRSADGVHGWSRFKQLQIEQEQRNKVREERAMRRQREVGGRPRTANGRPRRCMRVRRARTRGASSSRQSATRTRSPP